METNLTDADYGLLLRCYWAKGGGARGAKISHKRLIESGLALPKGINYQTNNESIFGARLNITEEGKQFLRTGKHSEKEVL